MPRDVGAVIVAAGQGTRFGSSIPKQFLDLGGAPILLHALRPFVAHPKVSHTVVVLSPEFADSPPSWLKPMLGEVVSIATGGASRRESVAAGLAALPNNCKLVVVHDGARPFPDRRVIDDGIASARNGHAAVPALSISETIKRADDGGRVLGTVPRQGLWCAQTPQAFPRELLERAHQAELPADVVPTDDAMLVEIIGGTVDLLPGSTDNLKVTNQYDLELAHWLLERRR